MDIIVGIDTGKTCGIACIDFNGRLVAHTHGRFAGMEWIVSEIRKAGVPAVVASDKPMPSEIIKRVNAAFNARLYAPECEASADEKRASTRQADIRDIHERDAYFAAMSAYHAFSNKLKQAERIASENGVADIDGIKAKVLRKYSISEAMTGKVANRK
jgi:hypothetical protein